MALPSTYTAYADLEADTEVTDSDTFLMNGAKTITPLLLRKMIMPGGIFVPPSGDTTVDGNGNTVDGLAIQAAITACQGQTYSALSVYLSGRYYLGYVPLYIGDSEVDANATKVQPACLIGFPHAFIGRTGAAVVDDYMLRMLCRATNTYSMHNVRRLANLTFDGNGRSRGAMVAGFSNFPIFENLRFQYTKGSALDIHGCWSSYWNSIRVAQSTGYAIRAAQFNDAMMNNVHVDNHYTMRHVDNVKVPGAATTSLIAFASHATTGGYAATVTEYGASLAEDWPEHDDAVAITYGGTAWNTDTDLSMQHSAVYIHGQGSQINNIAFEGANTVDDPSLVLAGSCLRVNGLYDESSLNRLQKIRINGSVFGNAVNNTISNVQNLTGVQVDADTMYCVNLVEIIGESVNNTLDGAYCQGITGSYIRHEADAAGDKTHRHNTVANAIDANYPSITAENWITEGATVTHSADVPTGLYG
jgi:hypothetical protein